MSLNTINTFHLIHIAHSIFLAVDCGPPPALTNGEVSAPNTTFQSVATYQCSRGYEFPSVDATISITCLFEGAWSAPTASLTCECEYSY